MNREVYTIKVTLNDDSEIIYSKVKEEKYNFCASGFFAIENNSSDREIFINCRNIKYIDIIKDNK